MITAIFEDVTFEQVRQALPKDAIPAWKTFTMTVEIPTNGTSTVNLYNRYRFAVSKAEALTIITTLAS